jgi:hypothetical protein
MKVAVINFSGNVGKSTIARHLLAPRLQDAAVFAVESINSDGSQDEALRGKQFGQLQEAMTLVDNAVIDIGASNVEDFVNLMKQYRGSHEEFDIFVVPTVPEAKQQRDTIATIDALASLGIPAKKIRLVFNRVELDDDPRRVFTGLFEYHGSAKTFTLKPEAVMHLNELYERLMTARVSVKEVLDDPTDFREQIRSTADPEEKLRLAKLLSIRRLATGVSEELDLVFKTLVH